jgi:lysophospholipase L1-like esterase
MKTKLKCMLSIVAIALIFSAAYSLSHAQTPKILCLGDSITYGLTPSGGQLATPYPTRLQSLTGIQTTNGGVSGNDVYQMLDRWNNEYKNQGFTIVALMGGTNDVYDGLDLESTKVDLMAIWQDALNRGCEVYALTIIPFDGRTEIIFLNSWISSQSLGSHFHVVDTYTLFYNHPEYFSSDNVHPSQAGANALAQAVYSALNPTPTITPTPTPQPTPHPSPSPGTLVAYLESVTVT